MIIHYIVVDDHLIRLTITEIEAARFLDIVYFSPGCDIDELESIFAAYPKLVWVDVGNKSSNILIARVKNCVAGWRVTIFSPRW